MKKIILSLLALVFAGSLFAQKPSFYSFKFKALDGKEYNFSQLKGKKVLIVNTASKCGYTPQYKELEELYQKFKDKNFVIIGFPANNFMGQEPGTNSEIAEFCEKNYGVTFPIMEKSSVKGNDCNPLFRWLCTKDLNGVQDYKVSWNFNKFLIDEKGNLVAHYDSRVTPLDPKILDFLSK